MDTNTRCRPPRAPEPYVQPTRRVLIADDERLFVDALELILATDGRIEVVGRALDGRQAVALARELEPDVVLIDLSMPGVDGFDAIAAIVAEDAGRRIVVLSGSADPADSRRRSPAGASRYLMKDRIADELVPRLVARRRCRLSYAFAACSRFFAVIHVLLSAALVTLILMHSGRDAGFGGMGFTPSLPGRHAYRRAEPDSADRGRRRPLLREHDRAVPPARVRATDGAARASPRHVCVQRRAAHDRLLPRRARLLARQEDRQLRRPAQLPPVLRRRDGLAGEPDHVLRVAAGRARPARPRDARVDRTRHAGRRRRGGGRGSRRASAAALSPGERVAPAGCGRDRQPRSLRRPVRRGRAAHVRAAGRGDGADRRRDHPPRRLARRRRRRAGGVVRAADGARPAPDARSRSASTSARSTSGCPTGSCSRSRPTAPGSWSTRPPTRLGQALSLPPWLEPERETLERELVPIV